MRAFNDDTTLEVILVEGSVSFDVDTPICCDQVRMKPSDVVQYDRLTGLIERSTLQSDNYKSRACGGGFSFLNETLSGITAQLSRAFNRKIIITDPELESIEFYAFFSAKDSLHKILNTLNPDRTMLIQEQNNKIYISKIRK